MARKSSGSDVRPGGEPHEPPCMGAGDDPMLSRTPAWAMPSDAGGGARGYLAASDPDFHRQFPSLADFLCLTGYGGRARKSGTLNVFCEDGKFKACLNDREGTRYAFVSSDSVAGLLEALDKALEKNTLDWRASKSWKK